jgi:hypothetical protein
MRLIGLAAAVSLILAAPAAAADDPWAPGCPDCTMIEPPVYMAEAIAAFAAAAAHQLPTEALTGPACRALASGDWRICRFGLRSACGDLDIAGQNGAVAVISFGVLIAPAAGCAEPRARAFLRAAAGSLVRCRDEAATLAAAAMLLDRAIDLSTPEKQAAFDAAHQPGEPPPPDIDIAATCGTMGGARTILPAAGGIREAVTLYVNGRL